MQDQIGAAGAVFLCNQLGTIEQVVVDEFGLGLEKEKQKKITDLADQYSTNKMQAFWKELQEKGAAFLWEVNVKLLDALEPLYFFGVVKEDRVVVICSRSPQNIFVRYDQLLTLFNEQAAMLRTAQKEKAEAEAYREMDDQNIWEEFMRINNELVNAQRELRRKNFLLEQQENRFRKIIYENADALLVVDENNLIRFVNPAAVTLLAEPEDFLTGAKFPFSITDKGPAEFGLWQEGKKIYVEMLWTEIDWEESPAYLVTLRDVSQRREAEALREEVQRITRHDLKSSLNAVIGMPQVLREDENLRPEQIEFLQLIEDAGYNMLYMINSSLNLIKMERGEYELYPKDLDLLSILRKIVPENQQLIKKKNLSLSIFIQDREVKDGDAFWVQGEELLCHTMLSNLVKNAVEAAPENSPIDISVQEDENYQIKIHNFGVVPEKIRDRFFEKYVTAGKKNGTGLGAYSAQLIARTHGGDISLSSSEESGTTLTVSFPKNYACLN